MAGVGVVHRLRGHGLRSSVGVALLAGQALLGPTPSPSPSPLPPPPDCATDLFPFAGSTVAAQPLPSPASSVGGEALIRPGRQVELPAGATPPPPLRGTAWLVADARTGDVLAACNAHLPLAPASTLKVLTALALIDVVPPTSTYSATAADASIDGTRAGLVAGSRYTADNLWHGLLLSSANDCAHALAELAGGQQEAANILQDKAYALGAADTAVVNTSGLDAPGQVSSAYDLALFARAALADPRITALARTRSYAFPAAGTALHGAGRTAYQIQNHNRLLFNYPGATGLKNGWTSTAGGAFVGTATRGERTYLVTLLRADTNTWRATAALLDWAFATGASARPVGTLNAGPVTPAPSATAPGSGAASPAVQPVSTSPARGGPGPWPWLGGAFVVGALGGTALRRLLSRRRRSRLDAGQRRPGAGRFV
jgi:D-alanyl-D-alanine carboxypeptidase (penicillin-binding protein 5/6)